MYSRRSFLIGLVVLATQAGLLFSLHTKRRGTFTKGGWVLQAGDV